MIYDTNMSTNVAAVHNFKIWKIVHVLFKLRAISDDTTSDHITILENSRPAGIFINYETYRIEGAAGTIMQL